MVDFFSHVNMFFADGKLQLYPASISSSSILLYIDCYCAHSIVVDSSGLDSSRLLRVIV